MSLRWSRIRPFRGKVTALNNVLESTLSDQSFNQYMYFLFSISAFNYWIYPLTTQHRMVYRTLYINHITCQHTPSCANLLIKRQGNEWPPPSIVRIVFYVPTYGYFAIPIGAHVFECGQHVHLEL